MNSMYNYNMICQIFDQFNTVSKVLSWIVWLLSVKMDTNNNYYPSTAIINLFIMYRRVYGAENLIKLMQTQCWLIKGNLNESILDLVVPQNLENLMEKMNIWKFSRRLTSSVAGKIISQKRVDNGRSKQILLVY